MNVQTCIVLILKKKKIIRNRYQEQGGYAPSTQNGIKVYEWDMASCRGSFGFVQNILLFSHHFCEVKRIEVKSEAATFWVVPYASRVKLN